MVTIKDIAEKAGVSRGTVDRVLHDRGRVSPSKAKKIKEIAEKMGYRPNIAGKGLAATVLQQHTTTNSLEVFCSAASKHFFF